MRRHERAMHGDSPCRWARACGIRAQESFPNARRAAEVVWSHDRQSGRRQADASRRPLCGALLSRSCAAPYSGRRVPFRLSYPGQLVRFSSFLLHLPNRPALAGLHPGRPALLVLILPVSLRRPVFIVWFCCLVPMVRFGCSSPAARSDADSMRCFAAESGCDLPNLMLCAVGCGIWRGQKCG